MKRDSKEFEKFDKAMQGLLAVSHEELQAKLEEEKSIKAKEKKKRTNVSASHASSK